MNHRVPAVPLITVDPYFSLWSPADKLTDSETQHWSRQDKPLRGKITIDGKTYRFIGLSEHPAMAQTELQITATASRYRFEQNGISLDLTFRTPLLLDDLDLLSTPCSYIDFSAASTDGKTHDVKIKLSFDAVHCYAGKARPVMYGGALPTDTAEIAWMGQAKQNLLSHSGDNVSIDWGNLYLAAPKGSACIRYNDHHDELTAKFELNVSGNQTAEKTIVAAYDDIASIFYFGRIMPGYWARNGKTIIEAIDESVANHDSIIARCVAFDNNLSDRAKAIHPDYEYTVNLAYRQSIAAHKLIVDEKGELIFLSKENDSNGCVGTVDLTYPSTPLFLLMRPELSAAMMRPVCRFARMPVWDNDFAPHDVGRYPYVSGQVYAHKETSPGCPNTAKRSIPGSQFPFYYLMPKGTDVYHDKYQMPVEESANMLILAAALIREMGSDIKPFISENMDLFKLWARYLIEYGTDPGDQLCTDDFAGHLAHNVNLAMKAVMGVEAYARLLDDAKDPAATEYHNQAKTMAETVLKNAQAEGRTKLAFDRPDSWSLKYNAVWDLIFKTDLFPKTFFADELKWYRKMSNDFGVPLDPRAEYTKSDWELWCAAMTDDPKDADFLYEKMAKYLKESESRVAFSDWLDTKTGKFVHFINRSVQAGLFMPLYRKERP